MPLSPLFLILAAQSQFTVTNASYSGPVERPAGGAAGMERRV